MVRGICKKFYARGNNKYELTVDLDTDWGFLIRTSNTSWDNGWPLNIISLYSYMKNQLVHHIVKILLSSVKENSKE